MTYLTTHAAPLPAHDVLGLPGLPAALDDIALLHAHDAGDPREVVYLSLGETWSRVPDALVRCLAEVPAYSHGYIVAPHGLPALHTVLRRFVAETHRLESSVPGTDFEVAVTQNGTRDAMFDYARLLLDTAGTGRPQLVCSAPSWDYPGVFAPLGYRVRRFALDPASGYQPDPERVRAMLRAAAREAGGAATVLVINAQHNPTGAQWDWRVVTALLDAAADTGAAVLVDDAYHGVCDPPGPTVDALRIVLTRYRDAVRWLAVRSLGKQFHCNGWGIGVLTGTPDTVSAMVNRQLGHHAFVSSVPLQAAMAAWLTTPGQRAYSAAVAGEYRDKRARVAAALHTELGFPRDAVFRGTATPYLRTRVPPAYTGPDAETRYRRACLTRAAVLPGGGDMGAPTPTDPPYIRFYLGASDADLSMAVRRLAEAGLGWDG
ncbi:pyridoxal phosphate-dependent aminotransferase [Nocardia sp. NPDC003482]